MRDETINDGVLFAKDLQSVQHLYEGKNMMAGRKPVQALEETKNEQEPKIKTHIIPPKFFKGFEEIKPESEKIFEFVAFYVTVPIIEKMTDDKWCLEFPSNIAGEGRRILHEVANYFELAHHSQGKDKSRRAIMYPRSQFLEKQEQERKKLEKEKDKLREKYKERSFIAEPLSECKTFREQVMRQIWEEQNGQPAETRLTTNMLDKLVAGMQQNPEDFIARMKPLLEAKKAELEKSEFNKMVESIEKEDPAADVKMSEDQSVKAPQPKVEEAKEAPVIKMTPQGPTVKKPAPKQSEEQSSQESEPEECEEDDNAEIDPELVKKEIRRREEKIKEAAIMHEYRAKLRDNTLQTFTDKPEPVNELRICNATPRALMFEWDEPCANNSQISGYTVFLNDKEVQSSVPECYCELNDLKSDTCYSVMVVAESDLGQGYKKKLPQIFKTAKYTDLCEVYVWGNNENSEIGLTDQLVLENKPAYNKSKARLFKPVLHTNFQQMCVQAAPGNINSCFLCVDDQERSFVISCGVTLVTAEGLPEITKNEILQSEQDQVDHVPSLPYMIDFQLPVVKVMCGSMFSGLLTADGQVFTWGENMHAQLGINNQQVTWCQRPTKVVIAKNEFVKDIACGYNHCVALTAMNQLFVWGRRMAAYPNLDLTFEYLNSKMNILRVEVDQSEPRLVKNNLIFYKFTKLVCGPFNTALVTDRGDLLLHGMNDGGQMAIGKELGPLVPFFPEFKKVDFFNQSLKVVDVALGASSCHVLAQSENEGVKMFAVGDNERGQHGNGTTLQSHEFQEVKVAVEFTSIAAGAYHVLATDKDDKCYGWGKMNQGQLGCRPAKGVKVQPVPIMIDLPKVKQLEGGSLFSVALV